MVLATGIDDPFDRLLRHFRDRGMDLTCRLEACAAVYQNGARGSYDQPDVGIQAFVFIAASSGITNVGVYTFRDPFELHFHCTGPRACTHCQDGHQQAPAVNALQRGGVPDPPRRAQATGRQQPCHGLI